MSSTSSGKHKRADLRAARREAAIARDQRQKRLRLLAIAGAAAILVAGLLIFQNLRDDEPVSEIDFASIPQNGQILGNPDAPVTIVEYADYQCSWCGRLAINDLPHIVDDFVRSGQVAIEFRAHPFMGDVELTSPDNESVQATVAASCADDQGKFWEYSHTLFTHQDGVNDGAFSRENLRGIAEETDLDLTEFDSCMESQTHLQPVLDQLAANQETGVNSTPTIIINGVTVGYTPRGYDLLKEQIEAALNGEVIPQ